MRWAETMNRAGRSKGQWLLGWALCGCASAEPPAPSPAPAPAATVDERADTAIERPAAVMPDDCWPRPEPLESPTLHAGLLAVAPQYFHASHRGGFDGYTGGRVFPWYDLYDLERPVHSPPGSRIAASTARSLFPVSEDGRLGVMDRDEATAHFTDHRLYPEEAVETRAGVRWVLARSGKAWHIVQFDADDRAVVHELPITPENHDVRIVLTASERLVVGWLERQGGRLSVQLSWDPAGAGARVVDHVEVPEAIAALSQRSRVDLALASDGPEGVAVAWRPLVDRDYPDAEAMLPQAPAAAQVRWMQVPSSAVSPAVVHDHATRALPLGGVTGIGPWPLHGNGMKGHRVGDRGLFVWLDDGGVLAVRAHHDAPARLADRDGSPLIALRAPDELLLFDSSPRVRAMKLRCIRSPR